MAILQLRANAPFVLRIGYNDHRSVLDALQGRECEGARVPIEVLVVEGHWAGRHRDLVDEAAAGRQLVIDYRVDQWTLGDGASALPAGRSSAFSLEEIEKGAKGVVREALAAQERTIWTVAPGCHIDDIRGVAWATTLRLLDETIEQTGRVPVARLVGTPAALATQESASIIAEALHERHVERLMLTVGPIGDDRAGENLLRLVRALSTAGIGIHLTHQGAIGLAALAMGAQSFDAGILGRNEKFDYDLQRERLQSGGGGRARKPRGYAAPLLSSIPNEILTKLFQLKAVRGALECDEPCCGTRLDGAVLHPVTHFVFCRCAQVRSVLDMPVEMRLGQVETLYGQAGTIYSAIRGVRKSDRHALESPDLEAVATEMAAVQGAGRQLRQVVENAHWAAV